MTKIVLIILTIIAMLSSAECVRGGFFATREEIAEVARTGKDNGWVFVVALVAVGLVIAIVIISQMT